MSTIATTSVNTLVNSALPSAKFAGRPGRNCPKCKGSRYWVNTMGGLVCLACSPPAETITDVESRLLILEKGTWKQFDPAIHKIAIAQIAPVQRSGDISSTFDDSAILDLFVDCDASGAFLRINNPGSSNDGQIAFQEQSRTTRSRWTPDERSIVDWFLSISSPEPTNSAALAQLSSRLINRRISPFEVVRDPSRFLGELRSQCEAGPSGPRQHYGGLIDNLRRLMFWTMEFESHLGRQAERQNQPSREPGDEPDEIDRLEELDSREPFDPRRTSRESFDFPVHVKPAADPAVPVPFPAFDLSALTFGL